MRSEILFPASKTQHGSGSNGTRSINNRNNNINNNSSSGGPRASKAAAAATAPAVSSVQSTAGPAPAKQLLSSEAQQKIDHAAAALVKLIKSAGGTLHLTGPRAALQGGQMWAKFRKANMKHSEALDSEGGLKKFAQRRPEFAWCEGDGGDGVSLVANGGVKSSNTGEGDDKIRGGGDGGDGDDDGDVTGGDASGGGAAGAVQAPAEGGLLVTIAHASQ